MLAQNPLTNPISKHRRWIPEEVDLLLKETLYFSDWVNIPEPEYTGPTTHPYSQSIFTAYIKGEYYNHDSDDNDWPSPIGSKPLESSMAANITRR